MRAFLTGSQVYGTPREDSDVNLVIYVSYVDKEKIIALSDNKTMPCKFGKLNIIFATTPEEYSAWLLGKVLCKRMKGHTREQVIAAHDQAKELFETNYDYDSGQELSQ